MDTPRSLLHYDIYKLILSIVLRSTWFDYLIEYVGSYSDPTFLLPKFIALHLLE